MRAPIIMGANDVVAVHAAAPEAIIVAVHMEARNHMPRLENGGGLHLTMLMLNLHDRTISLLVDLQSSSYWTEHAPPDRQDARGPAESLVEANAWRSSLIDHK